MTGILRKCEDSRKLPKMEMTKRQNESFCSYIKTDMRFMGSVCHPFDENRKFLTSHVGCHLLTSTINETPFQVHYEFYDTITILEFSFR